MKTRTEIFDTIAAISTPPGEGGIGIVRLSGEDSFRIVDSIFKPLKKLPPASERESFKMHLGYIVKNGKILDEVLVTYMKKPHTYTREDVVEINCHGGAVAVQEVLRAVLEKGARLAEPGEFTKRAFINGRIDLAQAEAVLDIVRAKTSKALQTAVNQLSGKLSCKVREITSRLKDLVVRLEAAIDFAEEEDVPEVELDKISKELREIKSSLEKLIESYDEGRLYRNGVLTTIVGKPNVGKSSLLNSFLKFERAIVTPIPGTTRDVIEEQINLKGIPFILADTAGITETADPIEKEGIKRSRSYLEKSQLTIFILDGSEKLDERDIEIASRIKNQSHIVVINKVDLPLKIDEKDIKSILGLDSAFVKISAKTGEGLKHLEEKMVEMVQSGKAMGDNQILVTNARHYAILKRAKDEIENAINSVNENKEAELISFDVRSAMDTLGEITGEITNADILNEIFSQFCIGK